MKLRFEFIMTKIHVLRVSFLTHYGGLASESDVVNSYGQYAQIMDVTAENNTFDVEIPYRAPYEWLKVPHGSGSIDEHTMGQWSLRVLNPLVTMESIAPFVECNVYMCAGDDIELKFFGSGTADVTHFLDTPPSVDQMIDEIADIAEELKVQSGLVDDQGIDSIAEAPPPVAVAPTAVPVQTVNDDDWCNLRTVFKRSAPMASGVALLTRTAEVSSIIGRNPILSYYEDMFRVWKGPLKMRVFTESYGAAGYVPSIVGANDLTGLYRNSATSTGMVPVQITSVYPGIIDVQIPFVTQRKFLLTTRSFPRQFGEENYTPGSYFLEMEDTPTQANRWQYSAGGDTFRFALLISVPRLLVSGSYYPHNGEEAVALPVAIVYTITAGASKIVKQEDLNYFTTNASSGNLTFTLSTAGWSNADWNRLYAEGTLGPGQVADPTLPQEQKVCDFTAYSFVARTTNVTPSSDTVKAPAYGFHNVFANGNAAEYIPDSGLKGVAADAFEVSYSDNYDRITQYFELNGIQPEKDEVLIPLPTSSSVTVGSEEIPAVPQGQVFIWDVKSNLAFNSKPAPPP